MSMKIIVIFVNYYYNYNYFSMYYSKLHVLQLWNLQSIKSSITGMGLIDW